MLESNGLSLLNFVFEGGLLVDDFSHDMEDGKTSYRLSDDDVINLQTIK